MKVSNSEQQFLSMIFTPEELDVSGAVNDVDLSSSQHHSKNFDSMQHVFGNKK